MSDGKDEAPADPGLDRCACSHLRRTHSGKTDKKKCTAHMFAGGADPMGQGKCDCSEFRCEVAR